MKKPAVSVLIPVYNAENYISDCLKSIQSQTFKDFEVICIDDGSIDNSLNILKECSKTIPLIRVISQKNSGVAVTRNRLMEEAQGKYIAFVDADDIISEDYLCKLYNAAEAQNADITKCFFEEISADGKIKSKAKYSHIFYKEPKNDLKDRFICGYHDSVVWGKLFRLDMLKKNKLSFYPGHVAEDCPFIALSFLVASKIVVKKEILYWYRKGLSNCITSNSHKMIIDGLHNFLNLYNQLSDRKLLKSEIMDEWIRLAVWRICSFRKLPKNIRYEQLSLQKKVWKVASDSIKYCSFIYKVRWSILFGLVKIFGWNSVYILTKIFR